MLSALIQLGSLLPLLVELVTVWLRYRFVRERQGRIEAGEKLKRLARAIRARQLIRNRDELENATNKNGAKTGDVAANDSIDLLPDDGYRRD